MTDTIEEILHAADTAIDRWYLEQLEFDQACRVDTGAGECGKPASWLQVCIACDASLPSCNEHRDWLIAQDRRAFVTFTCHACRASRPRLAELVLFVPIGYHQ